MKAKTIGPVVFLLGLATFCPVNGQESREKGIDGPTARLNNGVSVALTTRMVPGAHGRRVASMVTLESDVIHRVFLDKRNGLYFGYDLEIQPGGSVGQFKVSVRPLSQDFENNLREATCLTERGVKRRQTLFPIPLPKYPDPTFVADGDTIALDLLVNKRAGLTIVDIIKITSAKQGAMEPIGTQPFRQGPSRMGTEMRVSNFELLENGESVAEWQGTGCSGALLWFYLPGRGRIILSLEPHEGYGFEKLGEIEDNKIAFSVGANLYQCISSAPVTRAGERLSVWVLHDAAYEPDLVIAGSEEGLTKMTGRRGRYQSDSRESMRRSCLVGSADNIESLLLPGR